MKRSAIVPGILLLMMTAGIHAAETSLLNTRAPEFTLQDQFERTVPLRQFEGSVVVLIASDKAGKEQNGAWTRAIRDRYADRVALQGIADLSSVPFFLKGTVRNDIRKDRVSILLDWKGEVFRAYGLAQGAVNIIVIDGQGMVRHLHAGSAEPAALVALFRVLDEALARQGAGMGAGRP